MTAEAEPSFIGGLPEDRITVTDEHEITATDPDEPEMLPDPDPEVGSWPGWSDQSTLAPDLEPEAEP